MNLDEFVTIRGGAPPGPVIDTSLRLFRPGAPRADQRLGLRQNLRSHLENNSSQDRLKRTQ
eukprot:scaffold20152_cov63-Skeletonema_menzelii.AAC.1